MRKSKRLARGWFSILAACAAVSTSFGCTWDSSVYDAAAIDEGYVVACAPTLLTDDTGSYFIVGGKRCYETDEEALNINSDDVCKDPDKCFSHCERYRKYWNELINVESDDGKYVSEVCKSDSNDCSSIYEDQNGESVVRSEFSKLVYEGDLRVCPDAYPICVFDKSSEKKEKLSFACMSLCSKDICGKECVDFKTNVNHCGGCGKACAPGVLCNDGNCQIDECRTGQISCNGVCVDPLTSPTNCLAKGNCSDDNPESENYKGFVCTGAKEVCLTWGEGDNLQGKCAISDCSGEETLCATNSNEGNKCININSDDEKNCGACNYACSSHPVPNATSNECRAGECLYQCDTGYINVSASSTASGINCIDPKSNSEYCGATGSEEGQTGEKCATGQVCVDGECVQNSCSGSQTLCSTSAGNQCVEIKGSDTENCGACGYSCESGKPVNTTVDGCVAGECQYQCTAGLVNVSASSTATGIKCVDPKNDNTYCGAEGASATGVACESGKVCVDGKCVQNSCSGSETLCSTSSGNTCINIKGSDTANCGACGYSCESGKPVNTTVKSCSTGTCQYQCTAGLVNVSASSTATGIKCIDPKSDNTYCGATSSSSTGESCGSGKVCVDGKCVQNSCSGSETLCSTSSGNTCINIKGSDTANCGACGYSCESGKPVNTTVKSCATGVCQYQCTSNLTNVGSGNTSSSIQCVDLTSDRNNCGSKGNICASGKVCVNSQCVQNSCDDGQTLCSTGTGNTCVNIKGNDTSNCGACGYSCESGKPLNTTVKSCATGVCQYECATGYENKGSGNTASTIQCVESVVCDAPKCALNGFCFTTSQMTGLNYARTSEGDMTCKCIDGYYMDAGECKMNDNSNCGTKGKACGTNETCVNAKCVCAEDFEFNGYACVCPTGFHEYNGGCEIDSTSDCGEHGNACGTNESCVGGECKCGSNSQCTGYYKCCTRGGDFQCKNDGGNGWTCP